jgi:hypothetical protein
MKLMKIDYMIKLKKKNEENKIKIIKLKIIKKIYNNKIKINNLIIIYNSK